MPIPMTHPLPMCPMTIDQVSPLTRPIIIVGAPRSGTTLLGQVLKHHPALAYAEEPRLVWRSGNDGGSDRLTPNQARPEVITSIREHFQRVVTSAGRSRLLEKTPSNALRLPFVDRVFPDALYVHIVRNGFDSVLSIERFWVEHAAGVKMHKVRERLSEIDWRRAPHYAREMLRRVAPKAIRGVVGRPVWGPRIPGIDSLLRDLDLIEVCALQWRMCVDLALDFGRRLPTTRYFECRLEELNRQQLDHLVSFCGLDASTEVQRAFEDHFRPSMAGARKKAAEQAALERIRPWIATTMASLDYPTDPL
jgi:hypothetical protein